MKSEMVQNCPPAHQMFRTAQTIHPGALQLAECEGQSVRGVQGQAGPLHRAPGQAGVDRPGPGPGPGALQLQLLRRGVEEGGHGGAADVRLAAEVGGDGG